MVIKSQNGRGRKIHLLLDDEYVITTDADFWAENYIADNTDIDEEEWRLLESKINYRKAFNKCADLLSRRSHSVKELKDKLLRTVDSDTAERIIERFTELGYLDDEKYAADLSEFLLQTKHFSEFHVRQELVKRGIDKEIINSVFSVKEIDDTDSIISVINKSYIRKLNSEDGREKVIAALIRKGFKYSDIKKAFYIIENEE